MSEYSEFGRFILEQNENLKQENEKLSELVKSALDIISSGDSHSWHGYDGIGWLEKARSVIGE